MDNPEFPMRINKYLAFKKYSTRRGGDELVASGQVTINGKVAALGDKVDEGDVVVVNCSTAPAYAYYAYNKPRGVITHSPQQGEKDIMQSVDLPGMFPIGRLDKDSDGLIILTNDGRITDRLLNPDFVHEKEYRVKVRTRLKPSFKQKMESGVQIEDYLTKGCRVDIIDDTTFAIALTEGKKHQIRRMVSALGNEVDTLTRVRIMNIELGDLPLGRYRAIEGVELEAFLTQIGM